MKVPILGWAAVAAALALWAGQAAAREEDGCKNDAESPVLCGYEANSLGFTKDSDDVRFLDFNLSVRYRLVPWLTGAPNGLYFAFSGRFGQYVGTRDSSPVVGKRYEPKLFYRYWNGKVAGSEKEEFLEFAYGHESNGQSIDTPAELAAARTQVTQVTFASDQLSRGWDFVEMTGRWLLADRPQYPMRARFRYFLDHGFFQTNSENYRTWENDPEGKKRNRVSGLSFAARYIGDNASPGDSFWGKLTGGASFGFAYETGYRAPFQFNTFRFDIGFKPYQVPLALWYRTGYGSDLAQYYKRGNSVGLELQITNF